MSLEPLALLVGQRRQPGHVPFGETGSPSVGLRVCPAKYQHEGLLDRDRRVA